MSHEVWLDPFCAWTQNTAEQLAPVWRETEGILHRTEAHDVPEETDLVMDLSNGLVDVRYHAWQMQIDPARGYVLAACANPGHLQLSAQYVRERVGIPVLRLLRGSILLHASALCLDNTCVIFLAPQGTGKSTLAAAILAECSGHKLLADDVTPLALTPAGITALPSSTFLAMRHHLLDSARCFMPDSETLGEKTILKVHTPYLATAPCTPKALVVLDSADGWAKLKPMQAASLCLDQQFVLSNAPGIFRKHQFKTLTEILRQVPCYRLGINLDNAPAISETLKSWQNLASALNMNRADR
ncbi:MAG: hypothetical protein FWC40_04540 [Proteobacteria bacterium]|nr:hypothetical protein [Pseudomonadota bacterium]